MLFCPICGNCLLINKGSSEFRFFCTSCEYFYPIKYKIKNEIQLETKEVDDILGGKEAWENVEQTTGLNNNFKNPIFIISIKFIKKC